MVAIYAASFMASPLPKIPPRVEAELLMANKHTCCACQKGRRHTKVHQIDGDPANVEPKNLAVICTECSALLSDECGGLKYTEREIRAFKEKWEATCFADADDWDNEPVFVSKRTVEIRAKGHEAFPVDVAEDHLLLASVVSDLPVTVRLATEPEFETWTKGQAIVPAVLVEERSTADVTYTAPVGDVYVMWVANPADVDATVEVGLCVWEAEGDGDGEDEDEDARDEPGEPLH